MTNPRIGLPIATLVCSIAAFILAMICLLAGTNPSNLNHMDLYTLNTSHIGTKLQSDLGLPPPDPNFNFSSVLPRDLSDSLSNASDAIQSKADSITDDAKDAIKDPAGAIKSLEANISATVDQGKQELSAVADKVSSAAKNATALIVSTFINKTISSLTIANFYSSHLLTYCEGEYTTTDDGRHTHENITYCSNHKEKYSWNITNTTAHESLSDPFAFIDDLKLPDPVELMMKAITLLTKIIAAIYIIACIGTFFLLFTSVPIVLASTTPFSKGGLLRWGALFFALSSFLCLLLGTLLVHFLCRKICDFFMDHPHLGVVAYKGNRFMGCSIAATVFLGICVAVCMADLAVERGFKRSQEGASGMAKKPWAFMKRGKGGENGYDMEER